MNVLMTARGAVYANVPQARMEDFSPRRKTSITLTPSQFKRVKEVIEQTRERFGYYTEGHGAKAGSITESDEIGGFGGELAAALLLNTCWTGSHEENPKDGPDIGNRTQIRTLTRNHGECLLVRPHDMKKYGNVPFVLVKQEGSTFTLLGWCMTEEIPYLGRLTTGGHPERPPVWLVHQKCLHPIHTLNNV